MVSWLCGLGGVPPECSRYQPFNGDAADCCSLDNPSLKQHTVGPLSPGQSGLIKPCDADEPCWESSPHDEVAFAGSGISATRIGEVLTMPARTDPICALPEVVRLSPRSSSSTTGGRTARRTFHICVKKASANERMGLAVHFGRGGEWLIVNRISPGPLWKWNSSHPSERVLPGDVIQSINGCTDGQNMMRVCREEVVLNIVIDLGSVARPLSGSRADAGARKTAATVTNDATHAAAVAGATAGRAATAAACTRPSAKCPPLLQVKHAIREKHSV
eukprot:NODE_15804_length_1029_cov_6.851441.p1 GENE.NODE_15804_length_1029_cov_6.851441~~NODE_15804_length_1029_cov_6.851441.p1  ORF type:complete len:275 (+),score=40.24 NODE_15804_length_1029_cov_6.851441:98-922(+)